jgi:hypothetical protein
VEKKGEEASRKEKTGGERKIFLEPVQDLFDPLQI